MAFPPGITVATCTFGSDFTLTGDNVSISAVVGVVAPGTKRIVWAATGQSLFSAIPSGSITAGAGEALSFQVPHVDQAGFKDGGGNAYTDWGYRLDYRATGPNGGVSTGTIFFAPVVGQSLVDLDNVPDGSVALGVSVPIPAVTSVNGQTGAVTVTGGTATTDASLLTSGTLDPARLPDLSGTYATTSALATVVNSVPTTAADIGAVASTDVTSVVTLTQAEYDALTPDATTLYVVTS